MAAGGAATAGPWWLVGQAAAALAGMGVGRFVYTPILPLMHVQAGLSPQLSAELATSNYAGYLVGALALMPATRAGDVWLGLRFVAGVASALIFVIAANALLAGLRAHAHHLVGWGFGGVGAGIALSGGLVLVLRTTGTWQQAWWSAVGLAVVCAILAWRLPMPEHREEPAASPGDSQAGPRWFAALLTSYSLEGIGYIIAGTFLVAAIDQGTSSWIGIGAWVLVGLAAVPFPAHLRVARAVAILTTGYSVGQILGPVAVTPLLHNGYHVALLVSTGAVTLAAVAAGALSAPPGLTAQPGPRHSHQEQRRPS